SNSASFDARLDLRGFRMEEATKELEVFFDKALMTNASSVRIVHGKGDGTLRKIVRKKMKEIPGITEFYHPEESQGGDGVTIVKFVE
ncbi:MAG: Smr/MutS family protein, partial [Saprospiraceae bacterium]